MCADDLAGGKLNAARTLLLDEHHVHEPRRERDDLDLELDLA